MRLSMAIASLAVTVLTSALPIEPALAGQTLDAVRARGSVKCGIKSIKDMDGASFCLAPGGSSELNLNDWFNAHKMTFKPIVIDNSEAARRAFFAGRCDSYSGDQSDLASKRALTPNPQDYVILPEIIAK